MLGAGSFLLACSLALQSSSESVERELTIRALSLESSRMFVASGREGSRIHLESLGRRARARGQLEAAELGFARANLESEDATLREWALRCLTETRQPLDDDRTRAARLAEILAGDPHPAVRLALTKLIALSQEDHPNALVLLSQLHSDRHPDVARAALFAFLEAPEIGVNSARADRWQKTAAQAMESLLGPESPKPQAFLDAVEVAMNHRPPFRQGLLRRLAQDLEKRHVPALLGARALVEAARVEPDSAEAIDESALLEGFLVPLPGDAERKLPRAARRRIQRAATRVLGPSFATELSRSALEIALDAREAELDDWEGVGFLLDCSLLEAPLEDYARMAWFQQVDEEWWSHFFDVIRGYVHEFETEVLEFWLAPERSPEERWEALLALTASWSADAPLVRARFDEILHGDDRELARNLFELLARTQNALAGDTPEAQRAWQETDEILFRAWAADGRALSERVRDLDFLSRAAPHEAFRDTIFELCGEAITRTASVLELCSALARDRERSQNDGEGNASEALLRAHQSDLKELERAASAGEDLRELETHLRHELRAVARAEIDDWRKTALRALEVADSVTSDDVAKTAAALLAKSGVEGIEYLRGALSEIDLVRARLEILLHLAQAAEIVGTAEASSAATELRERYATCDSELKLRVLRALGELVQVDGVTRETALANAEFLTATALDGTQASQLRTVAVESLARACEVLDTAVRLRAVATELGVKATGLRAEDEGALEARLVALREIAKFAVRVNPEDSIANTRALLDGLNWVAEVQGAEEPGSASPPEAQLVRAELEREVLLPALASRSGGFEARLRAEWSRQLTGAPALAVLADRLAGRKLPRREFVLRSELAGLAALVDTQSAEVLLVPELDARSALLAVRVLSGQPEFRRALLDRAIVGFPGESPSEEAARFDLEARLRSLLLRLEAAEPGTDALAASLRFDLASPDRSSERAVELVFFASEAEVPAPELSFSVRARALRRLDNLIQAAKSRASVQDR